jgi:hypothetical protein
MTPRYGLAGASICKDYPDSMGRDRDVVVVHFGSDQAAAQWGASWRLLKRNILKGRHCSTVTAKFGYVNRASMDHGVGTIQESAQE